MIRSCAVTITLILLTSKVQCDLYDSSDPLVILNGNNFYETVLAKDNGWLLQFYASWCYYSKKVAPTWRELSYSVENWEHTIKVGVVDCGDKENEFICGDYKVSSYPTMRLFGPDLQKGVIGTKTDGPRTVEAFEDEMINFIYSQEIYGTNSESWSKLTDYEGVFEELLMTGAPKSASIGLVIIVDDEGGPFTRMQGRKTVMDLGRFPMVYARLTQSWYHNVGTLSLPAVVVVDDKYIQHIYEKPGASREELTSFIIQELDLINKLVEFTTRAAVLDASGTSAKSPPSPTTAVLNENSSDNITDASGTSTKSPPSSTAAILNENSSDYITDASRTSAKSPPPSTAAILNENSSDNIIDASGTSAKSPPSSATVLNENSSDYITDASGTSANSTPSSTAAVLNENSSDNITDASRTRGKSPPSSTAALLNENSSDITDDVAGDSGSIEQISTMLFATSLLLTVAHRLKIYS